jgi:hypothetical protein
MTMVPEILWCTNEGVHTVTALTAEARRILHELAIEGQEPVLGSWDGKSLIVSNADEADYLNTTIIQMGFRVRCNPSLPTPPSDSPR